MNPYKINGPALISFSGGRTSGFMLWNILQAHNGKLPDDVYVTFANTGKEAPETSTHSGRSHATRHGGRGWSCGNASGKGSGEPWP